MGTSINFNEKKGFICDMDGVIYHGNRILPGVAEFIQWLHEEDKEYLFLTNNSGYTPRELNQKLARMGLDVPEEHFYTSALATAAFLHSPKMRTVSRNTLSTNHIATATCPDAPRIRKGHGKNFPHPIFDDSPPGLPQ